MKKEYVFRVVLAISVFFLVYQFGFKPFFSGQEEKDINTEDQLWSGKLPENSSTDYDVIIYGAEPQGIAAAVSSARLGARTLLICNSNQAGGIIADCLIPELELPTGESGEILNGGMLKEMRTGLGDSFSDAEYVSFVNGLIKAEASLKVLYDTVLTGADFSGTYLKSVTVKSNTGSSTVTGRMYIDASDDGALLKICKVHGFNGSGDLNMEESFIPVSLNFEMADTSQAGGMAPAIRKLVTEDSFYTKLKKYEPRNRYTRLDRIQAHITGNDKAIISGLQISMVNVMNEDIMKKAYKSAVEEAKELALFLSEQFREFKNYRFTRPAGALRVRESVHFAGLETLSVNQILDNMYFEKTVAMGSYPVEISKFAASGSYVAGKGAQYGIPLGCLIPERTSNMLMAGPRISYSSLAASSAGRLGTSIATGEAAGAAAVYCIAENEIPANLNSDIKQFEDFKSILALKKMELPRQEITSREGADNWAYPAVRQLLSLGLVAGGENNDLKFDALARQKDLAYILMNGIYRVDRGAYSLDLDYRLRVHITNDKLTSGAAIGILGSLYEFEGNTDKVYEKLREQNRVNDVMHLRLKEDKPLTMADVYYLGLYSIRSYTGKAIAD